MSTYRVIPTGSYVRLTRTEQPSDYDNPWKNSRARDVDGTARAYEGSHALVLGNRHDNFDAVKATEGRGWLGHDIICYHETYGLCWLPSQSMEVVCEPNQ